MAKRHPALIPIARDHHEGLILAVRLQQGEQANLMLWSHDPTVQVTHVRTFYEQNLKRHFAVEEQQVFPLGRGIPEAVAVVGQLMEHHRRIEAIIQGFSTAATDELRPGLQGLGRLLEDHIRLEDRTLFPLLEARLPADVLAAAGVAIESYYA